MIRLGDGEGPTSDLRCPNCGAVVREGDRVCPRCGTPLPDEEVPYARS